MNKFGQLVLTKELPKMIFYAFFIIIISFVILIIFGFFINFEVRAGAINDHIPISILFNSPNCLAYEKDGRVYPGIIDFNKLDEESLSRCFSGGTKGVEINFYSLEDSSLDKLIELNKDILAKGLTCDMGNSKYRCYLTRKYVLYNEGEEFRKGILDFKVVSKDE
jgi:hypothetical protein